jgi:hypothetical protein
MTYVRKSDYSENLPIAEVLDRYEKTDWFLFGFLTTATPKTAELLLELFEELMNQLGKENNCFGKRLHWFARVEVAGEDHRHLHFLVGRHKVADGILRQFSAVAACGFLQGKWKKHGIAKIKPYDATRDGVGYVTKAPLVEMRDDPYVLSYGLKKVLFKGVTND